MLSSVKASLPGPYWGSILAQLCMFPVFACTPFLLGIWQARVHWHPQTLQGTPAPVKQVISVLLSKRASPVGAPVPPSAQLGRPLPWPSHRAAVLRIALPLWAGAMICSGKHGIALPLGAAIKLICAQPVYPFQWETIQKPNRNGNPGLAFPI